MRTYIVSIVAMAALSCAAFPAALQSQQIQLSLDRAKTMARQSSPDLRAAREAAEAARGREIQADAQLNPSFFYSTERTSGQGEANRQHIAGIEQPVEIGGQRGARRSAASFRRQAAEARIDASQASLDFEVTNAYANAIAADRRAALTSQAAIAFSQAGRVSEQRLAAGDISVYADRRLKLEAARYAALEAETNLSRRAANVALSALVSPSSDSIRLLSFILTDSVPAAVPRLDVEQLMAAALQNRSDFRVATLELDAFEAEKRVASLDRYPTPVISAGYKTESSAGMAGSLNGFTAGVALPIPLFDRRRGSIQAASAEARRAEAERESLRRRIARDVIETYDALSAVEQQRAILAPQLGVPARAALRSAQIAYSEGEITLLEWLDAVRAYHEAESSYANLVAEVLIRRAALERAVSASLTSLMVPPTSPGSARGSEMEKDQ